MYSVLCIQYTLLNNDNASAKRSDGRTAGGADEDDAMDDISHAGILLFMFNDYSSGLNFYYFTSLFCSALIMWILRKTTNDEKLLAILEARYKENKNNPKKLSGLAARLQAMQEQQMELQRKREELERRRNRQ